MGTRGSQRPKQQINLQNYELNEQELRNQLHTMAFKSSGASASQPPKSKRALSILTSSNRFRGIALVRDSPSRRKSLEMLRQHAAGGAAANMRLTGGGAEE